MATDDAARAADRIWRTVCGKSQMATIIREECPTGELRAENERLQADKDRLEWLEANASHYGNGWICRRSTSGRGLRLHESTWPGTSSTVRQAIDSAALHTDAPSDSGGGDE